LFAKPGPLHRAVFLTPDLMPMSTVMQSQAAANDAAQSHMFNIDAGVIFVLTWRAN